jgi:hypothetical protein
LVSELRAFKDKLTRAGNTIYQAGGSAHDDAVLSLSMAVWLGSQRWTWQWEDSPNLTKAERRAIDLEQSGEVEPLPGARPIELERAAAVAGAAVEVEELSKFEQISERIAEMDKLLDPYGIRWGD